jgi:hypothetical protein
LNDDVDNEKASVKPTPNTKKPPLAPLKLKPEISFRQGPPACPLCHAPVDSYVL